MKGLSKPAASVSSAGRTVCPVHGTPPCSPELGLKSHRSPWSLPAAQTLFGMVPMKGALPGNIFFSVSFFPCFVLGAKAPSQTTVTFHYQGRGVGGLGGSHHTI